jgi:hypothetical protein
MEPGDVEVLKRLIYKYFDVLFQNREFSSADTTAGGDRPSPKKPATPKPTKAPVEEDDDAPF